MAQQQPDRRKVRSSAPSVPMIPDKLYFRIGDVSKLCDLPAYVLRFWETEFPQLKPNKGGTGQRLYRKRDVEMVLEIKRLLYGEGFTIAGARRLLSERRRGGAASGALDEESRSAAAISPEPQTERKPLAVTAGKDQASPKKAGAEAAKDKKIKELRQEMQAILAMLGPDLKGVSPQKPKAAAAKRETKPARNRDDEPTLF